MISMETWVIYVILLLINWQPNVDETFTDILRYYLFPMNTAKVYVVKNYLNVHLITSWDLHNLMFAEWWVMND